MALLATDHYVTLIVATASQHRGRSLSSPAGPSAADPTHRLRCTRLRFGDVPATRWEPVVPPERPHAERDGHRSCMLDESRPTPRLCRLWTRRSGARLLEIVPDHLRDAAPPDSWNGFASHTQWSLCPPPNTLRSRGYLETGHRGSIRVSPAVSALAPVVAGCPRGADRPFQVSDKPSGETRHSPGLAGRGKDRRSRRRTPSERAGPGLATT